MSGITNFETIVIGLGAMGSAAVYQLSGKGVRVLGIDQFSPPHKFGSTHGDTRITRQAIGEGANYTPLSLRSYEIWEELERKTGKNLLTITGGLIVGNSSDKLFHGNSDFLQTTFDAAEKYDVRHSKLYPDELRKRFPKFRIEDDYIGYYEDRAGFLRPEICVETQIELARQQGAQININEQVQQVTPLSNGQVEVKTNRGSYKANKVIVSAGPWITQFFPEYADLFKVYRQALYWFDIRGDITPYLPENFPVFIFLGEIYGFPAIDGPHGGLKVSFEEYLTDTDIEKVEREISEAEIERAYNKYINKHLSGLSNKCIKAAACLYTVTPESKFVIDKHPEHPQIIIASPCSGHGFKHSAAIGEALSELAVEGESRFNLNDFKLPARRELS